MTVSPWEAKEKATKKAAANMKVAVAKKPVCATKAAKKATAREEGPGGKQQQPLWPRKPEAKVKTGKPKRTAKSSPKSKAVRPRLPGLR